MNEYIELCENITGSLSTCTELSSSLFLGTEDKLCNSIHI